MTTSRAAATGSLLARLLLLALLLIGLGVVHTLAHADAHTGITTSATEHEHAVHPASAAADTTPAPAATTPDTLGSQPPTEPATTSPVAEDHDEEPGHGH
ncbi:hypothetical protein [Streptomyces dysideae]|uniref:Uncharacterized protein n=1 Tax=Streptomyces dysideae TaxID=909626 RepID=A0A124IEY4_9ACTN|nr:hypothetical protein [Streptomyces dysideae]KUO19745.1 hypothetical protein AQJ91_18185 [Streptomyces dysideae]